MLRIAKPSVPDSKKIINASSLLRSFSIRNIDAAISIYGMNFEING